MCCRDAAFRLTYLHLPCRGSHQARPPRVEWLGSVLRRSSDNDIQNGECGFWRRQKYVKTCIQPFHHLISVKGVVVPELHVFALVL